MRPNFALFEVAFCLPPKMLQHIEDWFVLSSYLPMLTCYTVKNLLPVWRIWTRIGSQKGQFKENNQAF